MEPENIREKKIQVKNALPLTIQPTHQTSFIFFQVLTLVQYVFPSFTYWANYYLNYHSFLNFKMICFHSNNMLSYQRNVNGLKLKENVYKIAKKF